MALRIEDYGLIGDTQTAALVGRNGSIDWLCLPRFDSGACFAALVGERTQGRWLLAPAGEVRRVSRRYRDNTLILETTFETDTGSVSVVDCMPPRQAAPDLIRLVQGNEGEVPMRMELIIRFDYGSIVPWVQHLDGMMLAIGGPDALSLWSPVPTRGQDLTTVADFTVRAGDRLPFVMVWHPSHQPVPDPIDGVQAVADTETWWTDWCSHCTYDGPWRAQVLRSLITLKALTYEPTGGIVAAATTSVPEHIGGVRNWDYRYCWLRDATFTLYALLNGGYDKEAAAWRNWLLRAAAGEPSRVQTIYGPAGERRLTELELPWLTGYEGSTPVRIGNAAVNQFQLDIYGEVLDAMHAGRRAGIDADEASWRLQCELLKFLEGAWRKPDEGIWEVRGPQQHFTHSKALAWTAFDRAVKAVEHSGLSGPVDQWRRLRAEIHDDVCRRAFDATRNTFTQSYDSSSLDASLLMLPLVGFLPATDPRVLGTVHAIEHELMHDGFLRRYTTEEVIDGLPSGEGVFLACSFWLADNYVLQGRRDEAQSLFERLLRVSNDLGLLAEEYDPIAGRLLGNFPQAFSHVGLINTARNLARRDGPAEQRQRG